MHVLWARCGGQTAPRDLRGLEEGEAMTDNLILGVELARAGVSVDGVGDLVVAALVEGAEVEPDFGDVRVYADGAGVGVESVAVLVDLEVEHSDGAPEGGVAAVTVDGLLIGFVSFVVFLTLHVCAAEEVPALCIGRICGAVLNHLNSTLRIYIRHTSLETLCQILNCQILIPERRIGLMMQPSELLEDLCVMGLVLDDALVSVFCAVILGERVSDCPRRMEGTATCVFLLFIHVAHLEPYVNVCQRVRRAAKYALKTLPKICQPIE